MVQVNEVLMNPFRKKRQALSIFFLVAVLSVVLACQLGGLGQGQKVIQTLPVYPDARLTDEFSTSYPDSTPSTGVIYLVDAEPDEIIAFFIREMSLAGWELINVLDSDGNIDDQMRFEKDSWECFIQVYENDPNRYIMRVSSK